MKIVKTTQFDDDLVHVEDYIFSSNQNDIQFVERFQVDLDSAVRWLQSNSTTPKEDEMGDRSWPFYRDHRGRYRYRLKYLITQVPNSCILMKRIIDNREQNLDTYPSHKLDTYSDDDE